MIMSSLVTLAAITLLAIVGFFAALVIVQNRQEAEIQAITQSRRIIKKAAGVSARKRKLPGSRGSGFRKKLDGTVIRVENDCD